MSAQWPFGNIIMANFGSEISPRTRIALPAFSPTVECMVNRRLVNLNPQCRSSADDLPSLGPQVGGQSNCHVAEMQSEEITV
jgi:hypothetical protein